MPDGAIEFTLDRPRKRTLPMDGDTRTALHFFAGAPEQDVPSPGDPKVLSSLSASDPAQTLHCQDGKVQRR